MTGEAGQLGTPMRGEFAVPNSSTWGAARTPQFTQFQGGG